MKIKTEVNFADMFKALSHENRLKVFEIIRQGHKSALQCRNENRPDDIPEDSVCVCEILEQMEVSAPTLSHHLKELRIAGLVDVFNRGQWSYYIVHDGVMETLADYFMSHDLASSR